MKSLPRKVLSVIVCAVVPLVAACGSDGGPISPIADPDPGGDQPPPPPPPLPPGSDAAAGKLAFEQECAGCHTARDGFDVAFFGFSDQDVVRRAVAHVDSTTAGHIVTYLHTLNVTPASPSFRPFQPGGGVLASDRDFWTATFGTTGFPAGLTPAGLKAIDPRQVSVALSLPVWSSESDDSDWLADHPLVPEILDASGGAVRTALDAYYASSTTANLEAVLDQFGRVTTTPTGICSGEAADHDRPEECFQARRWMSSLAGQHFLRRGSVTTVPFPVAEIWWQTGEVAVSIRFKANRRQDPVATANAANWLYLGYTFAPGSFPERDAYMGQHLQMMGMPRLAAFTALRRMVDGGPADQADMAQRYWDAALAAVRAPKELKADVVEFAFDFIIDGLQKGLVPTGKARDVAIYATGEAYAFGLQGGIANTDPTRAAALLQKRDRILALIG